MMQPTHHEYRAPGEHNSAAIFGLVCVLLWPLTIIAMMLANSASNAPDSSGPALPDQIYTLLQCGFSLLPVAGIIASGVGLNRAIRRPLPRKSLWLALAGLLLSGLWFIAAYIVIG